MCKLVPGTCWLAACTVLVVVAADGQVASLRLASVPQLTAAGVIKGRRAWHPATGVRLLDLRGQTYLRQVHRFTTSCVSGVSQI